ncbi:MAG: 2-oxo acid dehydrogenase subunit E2 [Candidatus Limnocylindrales bacterium]
MAKVTMPQLGESVAEGTIGKWLKQPGDTVAKYEPLLEVITDKVNAEVPSPFEGVLKEILAEEGATVPNNAEIAVIETADEAGSTAPPPVALEKEAAASEPDGAVQVESRSSATAQGPAGSDETNPAEAPAASDARSDAAAEAPATGSDAAAAPATPSGSAPITPAPMGSSAVAGANAASNGEAVDANPDARMTPAVRRLLREHDLTPSQIRGTGGGGRITRDDVTAVVEALRSGATPGPGSPPANGSTPAGIDVNGSGPGSRPGRAPEAAPASTQAPAPASAPASGPAPSSPPPASPGTTITFPEGADEVLLPMTQMRKGIAAQMTRALAVPHAYVHMEVDVTNLVRAREEARRDYQAREGISLSYVPFVIKATVEALRRQPSFNAHWTEPGLVAKRRIHMGVAVAVDDGLLVPVVRDVDGLSISGLNRAIADVAARARAGKLKVDDYGGSTFTIDNTGWFGSNLTMPIINVPEVAILTMEAITKRPVVRETPDGDVIAIRPMMNMVLAIDHRANDGAQAAAFLKSVKSWLEAIGPETPVY